jgi:DNA polymerase III subunit epsilon
MNHTFTAIDFETAQGKRHSICQVGLVRIEDGRITDKINKLVCPPDNFYHYKNIEIHGITPERTKDAPCFADVWSEIEPYIVGQTVVAHNAKFDVDCLSKTLDHYSLPKPQFEERCTYHIYKKPLRMLCTEYNIMLNHHDALSDALACAELYLRYLRS